MAVYLKLKAKPFERGFEIRRVIDEHCRLGEWYFLFELSQKQHRSFGGSCRVQPDVQELWLGHRHTKATLGAVLGMLEGRSSIPERWIEPLRDWVVVSPEVFGFDALSDVGELTHLTRKVAEEVIAARELPVTIESDRPTSVSDAAVE